MKAVRITAFGPPSVLRLQEVPDPRPAEHEILVRVHATALNRADLLQRLGKYPPPEGTRADIPGLEFAGEVEAAGEAVSRFRVGDRVMGLLPGEGYAEKVVTPEEMALPIPTNLSFVEAAAIPEVFLTAYDALVRQLRLKQGERLLVHAVGSGVGIAALQIARHFGATTFGTAGTDEKLRKARDLGLDVGVNYTKADFAEVVRRETHDQGVDAILDLVGASYWDKNIACLAQRGRMILIGLLGGAEAKVNLARIMWKRLRIFGSVMRGRSLTEKADLTRRFETELLPAFASGDLKPVVDRVFPLHDAAAAHAYMEANRNFGKIVLQVAGGA